MEKNLKAGARLPDVDEITGYELAGAVGHLLRLCQQRAVDLFVSEVGEDGPTPRQFATLLCIYQNQGLNQTDLVQLSGIDRSTLTEMLRRLVDRGLVRRERTVADQRTNALYITSAGESMLRENLPKVVRAQERILEAVPKNQRSEIMRTLEVISGRRQPDPPIQ